VVGGNDVILKRRWILNQKKALAGMLAAALMFCASGTARAQDRAGTISVSPLLGGCLFEGDQHLKTSAAYGGTVGYYGNENTEIALGFSFIDSGTRHGNSEDVNTFYYHVDGVYHLKRHGNLQPYIDISIGGMTFDHERSGSTSAVAFSHGFGMEYFISENIALRTDERHIITFNGGFNDLMFTAGMTYFIGGKKGIAESPAK
jgi:OmpA-OmpF porin, OOP family